MLLSLLSRRSLEVDSRDSYGFALRPQHTQRYKEYAVFYEEEEEERAEKWKKFLEQILEPEEKSEESLQSQVTQAELSVRFEKEEYQESQQAEANTLKPDSYSGCEEKSEATKEIAESFLGQEDVKEQSQPEYSEVEAEANSGQEEYGVIVQDGTAEEITESVTEKEEVKESLNSEDTKDKPETVSGQIILQPENTEGEVQSNSTQGGEADESGDRECVHSGSTEGDTKNDHLSKGTKTKKVQTWAPLRKSLGAIEDLMCSRVKDIKMKFEQKSKTRDSLPSIEESLSMEKASEENCEEEVCKRLMSDDSANESSVDSAAYYSDSPEHSFPWKEELESLVHGGVPKDLRGEVWQAFVGVKARRVEKYYQNLLDQIHADEGREHDNPSGVPRKWKRQIEKDIPRTFPGHPALDENGRNSLRRVLLAYAQHNPSVGYCQAMNFFAGLLLLLMPEENAFWALAGIIDEYFDGYYSEEMIESQVDQLVFEELMRERFPKLVNHLDYLGVQVTWISAPWFLSIFLNMLPWESVLRIWDVLLFEGNRVMLFRTALALMELYGPPLIATKDAGDAITLLQSLAGSTFDSSQLVLTASMGYLAINESRLQDLREKHRPAVVELVEQRMNKGRVWKDTKGLASKLYSFKHDRASLIEEAKSKKGPGDMKADGIVHLSNSPSNLDELLTGLAVDSETDSLPDLQEQVIWLKVELCRSLQEKRAAELRAEELETALMEMVKQDNRRQLSARIEQLEQELIELRQALADKKEQETAMLQVLMRIEQEQRIAEDARRSAEQEAAAQRCAVQVLQEKYDKAMASLGEMEKRKVMAESLLEATLQYETGQARAQSSPRSVRPQENSSRMLSLFGWRDKTKTRQDNVADCSERKPDDIKKSDI